MEEPEDVILYLFPHRGEGFEGAVRATAMPENKSRFLAARRSDALKPHEIPRRQERGGTELPVERGLVENTDCLVVRFSHSARTRVGVVCGHALNANLVFQNIPGISKFHFAFTFDDQYRPIVRDLGSTGGTKVTYNGENGQRRSKFDWLLQGPSIARGKPPVLNITDLIQFKVIVPPRDITLPDYIDKVTRFRAGTADPEDLSASFILLSAPGTRLPTGQQTPLTDASPILYKKKLGAGAFGVVKYTWNVTTGDEYVVKRPLQKLINSGQVDEISWRNEAEIMRGISHDHIVAFRDATFSSYPQLEFEYVPGGSLDIYMNLSTLESTQVLCQLSSALEYLHNQQPSVGHRDIKPANILVVKRGVDGIYVKFADFGLSKAADTLKTFCGTLEWAAPEIYLKAADRKGTANDIYSVAVDIWSLGVVVASLECGGLPVYEKAWETDAVAWIHTVQRHVTDHFKQQGSQLLWLLLDNMLVEDPEERSSADYCHGKALELLQKITNTRRQESDDDDDDGSTTPKPWMLGAQSVVESEKAEEASTFRLKIQSASSDGSEIPIRETVEDIDKSVIANRQRFNPTDSEEEWNQSGALPQGSIVDGLLWNSEYPDPAGPKSNYDGEATKASAGEAQTKDLSVEDHGMSFFIRHQLGGEVPGDGTQDAVETSRVKAVGFHQSMHKRSRPEESSLLSLPRSFTRPVSGIQRRAVNRDLSSTKRLPDHKRSKKGE